MKNNSDIHGGSLEKLKLGNKDFAVEYDFSVNINPLGFPPVLNKILLNADKYISDYPPVEPVSAEKAIAGYLGKKTANIILANGGTEIFNLILMALKPKLTAWCIPTYSGYGELCSKHSLDFQTLPMLKKNLLFSIDFKGLGKLKPDLVFICNPNNPTGQLTRASVILEFAEKNPGTYLAVDESFMDFYKESDKYSLIDRALPENIIIIKSLTKTFATAGLRMGYAYGSKTLIDRIKNYRQPWTVNGLAQAVIPYLFEDKAYLQESRLAVAEMRNFMMKQLSTVKELSAHPSETNFVLCEIKKAARLDADNLRLKLLEKGIFVRSCSTINGLGGNYIRLAVRPQSETEVLIREFKNIFGYKSAPLKNNARTKALMIVGTASNSGKSIVASAFCRYYANKGIKVAPFKAQNMALNSFVTPEGCEIGRAQAVQAQACRIEPESEMNPVLLKPLGDSTSQVIVNGKPFKVLSAVEYYKNKNAISRKAFDAYDRLKARYDMIVLEGAGSPTEINLLNEDFVNMRMAEYAEACTILVADIDRGGVFASIFGTIKLLPPKWRKLIKGIIINKFRGDKRLLDSGIKEIEDLTGIPVLGVLPYIKDLAIEEEDSLGLEKRAQSHSAESAVNIAVIRLPRMSNYTDFMPFENIEGVNLSYVSSLNDIGEPDLVFIPGTKNTIADMIWLKENGFAKFFNLARKKGTPIIGICGGFQILGETILDPHGVEGKVKEISGLGLLPLKTTLAREKELAQVSGYVGDIPFLAEKTKFTGYEIHAGVTEILDRKAAVPPLHITARRAGRVKEDAGSVDGNIFGCYVHGFFDNPEITSQLLNWLYSRKGKLNVKAKPVTMDVNAAREEAFERLAVALAENLNMKLLNSELGV